MNDSRRTSLRTAFRDALSAAAQALGHRVPGPSRPRLVPATVPPSGGWLLLADGRPPLLVRRRR